MLSILNSFKGEYKLSQKQIRDRLESYGFVEVGDILRFLDRMCGPDPEVSEYLYIRSKLGLCLQQNDDESDYFVPLREFAAELDCLI